MTERLIKPPTDMNKLFEENTPNTKRSLEKIYLGKLATTFAGSILALLSLSGIYMNSQDMIENQNNPDRQNQDAPWLFLDTAMFVGSAYKSISGLREVNDLDITLIELDKKNS